MKSHELSGLIVPGDIIQVQSGLELNQKQIGESIDLYKAFRDMDDEACRIGLYGSDLEAVLSNSETILFEYKSDNGSVHIPLLVPISNLEWYNDELIKKTYGDDIEIFYYAHPPIPDGLTSTEKIIDSLKEKTNNGAVIIFDKYADKDLSTPLQGLIDEGSCATEYIGGEESKKVAPVFAGRVNFEGLKEIKQAPSLLEVYKHAVARGEFVPNDKDGLSLVDAFTEQEAKKIWDIVYEQKFVELGVEDPIYAGFDKEHMIEILTDSNVAKIILKEDNEFRALCFFDNKFENFPWFNSKYYQEKYPEYFDTGNIYIFPGIVASKEASSATNAIKIINFATKMFELRGTNAMLTFECTQISAKYIPTLTWFAINHSGVANIENAVKEPISLTEYFALRKMA